MIENVIAVALPTGEHLAIRKNHLEGTGSFGRGGRIAVVSGTHGDELEGQYVCYEIARRIKENPGDLCGSADIYPALNPLGIDLAHRSLPLLEMDMNRIFPGNPDGGIMDQVADAIVRDIAGADFCIDVHASDTFVREIPQVRISEEFADKLLPYARMMNVDMIWTNATATVHESTLAHSMNMLGVPTLVVEMGLGTRISRPYGDQVAEGIFNLMREIGLWRGRVGQTQMPVISTDGEVEFIRADRSGVFLPTVAHNHYVHQGDKIGEIIDVMEGTVEEEILAHKDGLVFTLREYPFVYEGALIARILTEIGKE